VRHQIYIKIDTGICTQILDHFWENMKSLQFITEIDDNNGVGKNLQELYITIKNNFHWNQLLRSISCYLTQLKKLTLNLWKLNITYDYNLLPNAV
jgi:hypothetical protein